jgi:hypothetical protein
MAEQAHSGVGTADDRARLGDGQASDDPESYHLGLLGPEAPEESDGGFDRRLTSEGLAHIERIRGIDPVQGNRLRAASPVANEVDGTMPGDGEEPGPKSRSSPSKLLRHRMTDTQTSEAMSSAPSGATTRSQRRRAGWAHRHNCA